MQIEKPIINKTTITALASTLALLMILPVFLVYAGNVTNSSPMIPSPQAVTGWVYWPNGTLDTTVAIPVQVTNQTGESVYTVVDVLPGGLPDGNYQVNINATVGDIITVNCTYADKWIRNTTIITNPFSLCDLHLVFIPPPELTVPTTMYGTVQDYYTNITGQSVPNATVELFDGFFSLGTCQADINGSFSFNGISLNEDNLYISAVAWFDPTNTSDTSSVMTLRPINTIIGGSMNVYGGEISLDVPAGSISQDTLFSAVESESPMANSFSSIDFGPSGFAFLSPATIEWSYATLDLGMVDESALSVFMNDGSWTRLQSEVDTINQVVRAEVWHFTDFSFGTATAVGTQYPIEWVYPGQQKVGILNLTITDTDLVIDDTLQYLQVTSNSTDDNDILEVQLWRDGNANLILDGSDSQVGTGQSLVAGNANFTGLSENIPASTSVKFFVALNVSSTATVGDFLDLLIPVSGIGMANAGVTIEQIDPNGSVLVNQQNLTDPHVVYGYVDNIAGHIPNVWVNVTNNRTGSINFTNTDSIGRYEVSLGFMPGGYLDGDEMFVQANDSFDQTGWNTTVVNASFFGERCDLFLGVGPFAHNETPTNGSSTIDIYQNITINITSGMTPLDQSTIILAVNGTNYTWPDPSLSLAGEVLMFDTTIAIGSWYNGQVVNVTLWQANDSVGNPCQNAPYSWWFQVSLAIVTNAPDIRVHKQGNDVNITWNAVVNASQYVIYRSLEVNGTGFNWSNPYGIINQLYYVDSGALIDNNNYSYIVCGASLVSEGPRSNIGWKIRKQLVENAATSDINWLSLPYNSDLILAQDLITDLGGTTNVNYVARWVVSTQSYQNKPPVGGFNWPITAGEGILVNMKTTINYTIVGSYNNSTTINIIENPTTSDINWISLPYHSTLLFAQDLINNLGGTTNINYVARWVVSTQSYQNKPPVGGFNWSTTPGEAILVNAKVTIPGYNLGPVQIP
jgi:hypothetical protein